MCLKHRGRNCLCQLAAQIEAAILSLSSKDFEKLRHCFFDMDYQRWDEQLERDIADGSLEVLAQEAIAEFEAGHCLEV
ncbi:MAG: hypothetical protein PUP91_16540 [Rhizonema sp. PD37]|nr:hypothetical protein [Rhizonema sp. PD37]